MSAGKLFQNSKSSIPKSDPRIVRIDMSKSDLGAPKSHTKGALKKNDYHIKHVGKGS